MRVAFLIDHDGVPVVATSNGKIIIATTGDELREATRTDTWTPVDLDTDTVTITEWMGGQARVTDYGGEKKRCPNCEHEDNMHGADGCWFTLPVGRVDESLVCKCPATRETVDRAWQ